MTAATREHLRSLVDLRVRALVGEQGELVRYCYHCSASFDVPRADSKATVCASCSGRHEPVDGGSLSARRRRERQRAYRQTPQGKASRRAAHRRWRENQRCG